VLQHRGGEAAVEAGQSVLSVVVVSHELYTPGRRHAPPPPDLLHHALAVRLLEQGRREEGGEGDSTWSRAVWLQPCRAFFLSNLRTALLEVSSRRGIFWVGTQLSSPCKSYL
jgi:hypothetical protein